MTFSCITFEQSDNVAKITLNRPEALNALNDVMIRELETAMDTVETDESIRSVIITANGRAFCSGGDLRQISTLRDGDRDVNFSRLFHHLANRVEDCPKPIVAAVNGLALGGGLELVNVCDIVICSEQAHLGDQHANYGLVAGGGNTQRLPRLIPPRKAKELLLTGDWISAAEAEKLGLVNSVVPADELQSAAMAQARKLATRSPMACKSIKYLFKRGLDMSLPDALSLEIEEVGRHVKTDDFAEGVQAFIQGRTPQFKGR